MEYQFIINLSEEDYVNFLGKYEYQFYKHEVKWSDAPSVLSVLYVGVQLKKKLVAAAKVEIKKSKNDVYYNIQGGPLLDYTDIELLKFFTKELCGIAKENGVYKIKMDVLTSLKSEELESVKASGFKLLTKNSNCSAVELKQGRKFLTPKFFENILCTQSVEKDGLFFELIKEKKQIKNLYDTLENWSYKTFYKYEELLKKYKDNIAVVVEKIDLIFYLNYLREHNANMNDVITIEELIEECGDDYILGFAVVLFPENQDSAYCLEIKENGSFPGLNTSNQLLLQTIKLALERKYTQIIYFDPRIYKDYALTHYNFEIITKRFTNLLKKFKK